LSSGIIVLQELHQRKELYFDGAGDPEALLSFGFQQLSQLEQLKMVLLNGAKACNIFWVIEGAASIEASSTLKGTIMTHAGATTMGAEGNLEGRLFSIVGAISLDSGAVSVASEILVVDLGVLSTFFFLVVKVPLLMEVLR
jgi:hypothetical protein